jgi:four helix bundle protein
MAIIDRFNQLEVWKKAHRVVVDVCGRTRAFPASERFVLGVQMRRAAISVPANIAEGSARRRPSDKAHFYTIARSSAEELRYYFILSEDLGYLNAAVARALDLAMDEVCRMLYGMIESMEARKRGEA